jgi:hypothetical protein
MMTFEPTCEEVVSFQHEVLRELFLRLEETADHALRDESASAQDLRDVRRTAVMALEAHARLEEKLLEGAPARLERLRADHRGALEDLRGLHGQLPELAFTTRCLARRLLASVGVEKLSARPARASG